jgi:hypothetical protein
MLDKLSKNQKIAILLTVAVLFVSVIIYISIISSQNQYGNGVNINSLDSTVNNISKERKDSIKTTLYNTIKSNSITESEIKKISDAKIRKDSNLQNYDKNIKLYTGSFIVDIESIKQSYLVQYTYSPSSNSEDLGGNPTSVSCLEKSKLIYGDFGCKDIFTEQNGADDPILQYLPKSTLSYQVDAAVDSNNGIKSLEVNLQLSNADYKTGIDTAVAQYKKEVSDWILSLGLNPDGYTINYNY